MMCGIDQAIQHIREDCSEFMWAERVINRLEYHRNQAIGVKPRYHKGQSIKDYYTCGNCGKRVEIQQDFCWGCGYRIKWDSIRCLTGLPLVDAVERSKENDERGEDQGDDGRGAG
jgi:hypothetical protein